LRITMSVLGKRSHEEEHEVKSDKKSKADERALPKDLTQKLDEYRKRRNFNAEEWINKKVQLFNDYLRTNKLSACLVSLSGGVDSAVTLGLMKRALDAKDSPLKKILEVSQPIHSSAWAYDRAKECADAFQAPFVKIDQTEIHNQIVSLIDKEVGIKSGPFATGQLRSYLRTPAGYYISQLLSQEGTPCVVMGTGNKDEDGYLAYFCKAGDGVVDIQLIADIHKSEVYAVGAVLGVPKSILEASPSADLWPGQTDEDELGFSYDFVELFTGAYVPLNDTDKAAFRSSLNEEALAAFKKWSESAEKVHNRNKHKIGGAHNINIL